jgi:hypothetical protein
VRLRWVWLLVPRAPGPQGADELHEPGQLGRGRYRQTRHPQRRQMVGLDGAVDVRPGHCGDRLVGQTEMVKEHANRLRPGADRQIEGELDLREHGTAVALGHEEGAALPGHIDAERGGVDDTDTGGNRVDAQPLPRQVQKRQGRNHLGGDAVVGPQQLDRPFGYERRTRHQVADVGTGGRLLGHHLGRRHDVFDDGPVDVVEAVAFLVVVVEVDDLPHSRPPPLPPPPDGGPCAPGTGRHWPPPPSWRPAPGRRRKGRDRPPRRAVVTGRRRCWSPRRRQPALESPLSGEVAGAAAGGWSAVRLSRKAGSGGMGTVTPCAALQPPYCGSIQMWARVTMALSAVPTAEVPAARRTCRMELDTSANGTSWCWRICTTR